MSIPAVDQGRVANPRPVAKIKTGRISQPITDAADATGLGMQRAPVGDVQDWSFRSADDGNVIVW